MPIGGVAGCKGYGTTNVLSTLTLRFALIRIIGEANHLRAVESIANPCGRDYASTSEFLLHDTDTGDNSTDLFFADRAIKIRKRDTILGESNCMKLHCTNVEYKQDTLLSFRVCLHRPL